MKRLLCLPIFLLLPSFVFAAAISQEGYFVASPSVGLGLGHAQLGVKLAYFEGFSDFDIMGLDATLGSLEGAIEFPYSPDKKSVDLHKASFTSASGEVRFGLFLATGELLTYDREKINGKIVETGNLAKLGGGFYLPADILSYQGKPYIKAAVGFEPFFLKQSSYSGSLGLFRIIENGGREDMALYVDKVTSLEDGEVIKPLEFGVKANRFFPVSSKLIKGFDFNVTTSTAAFNCDGTCRADLKVSLRF